MWSRDKFVNAKYTQENIFNKNKVNENNCGKMKISNFENKNFVGRGSEANVYGGKNSKDIIRVIKLSTDKNRKDTIMKGLIKEAKFQNETNNNRHVKMSPYVYDIFTCKGKAYVVQERMSGTLTHLIENAVKSNTANFGKLDTMIENLIIKSNKTKLAIEDYHFNNIVYNDNELYYIDWNSKNGYIDDENLCLNIQQNMSAMILSLVQNKYKEKMRKTLPMFRKRQIIPDIFFALTKEIKDVELLLKTSNAGMKGTIPSMQLAVLNNIVTWNTNNTEVNKLTTKLVVKTNKLKRSRFNKSEKVYKGQPQNVKVIKERMLKNIQNENRKREVWGSYIKLAEVLNKIEDLSTLLTTFKQYNTNEEKYRKYVEKEYTKIMKQFSRCNKQFQKHGLENDINNIIRWMK